MLIFVELFVLFEGVQQKVIKLLLLEVILSEGLGVFNYFLSFVIVISCPLYLGNEVGEISFDRDIMDVRF